MLHSKILVLTFSLLATAVAGAAVNPPTDAPSDLPTQPPNGWISYDNMGNRTDLEIIDTPNGDAMTRLGLSRTPIKACENDYSYDDRDCRKVDKAKIIARTLGTMIKEKSNDHDCSSFTATLDKFEFEYYATGRNCDTTAEQGTIAGAIYHFIHSVLDDNICNAQCMKLTHGGTWTGWLSLGPSGSLKKAKIRDWEVTLIPASLEVKMIFK
ncbi:hypothetical protein ASPSYDRAFT_26707 [Aspergillus sydowii CBS 593.65]|uniref:Secreted protein CSS2 C-terminal domain-containing protein n=1 Tax=Aspergillus sydowii CBS 593.65 TaxID=1036612 RepID=A0A1L9TZ58_9EURO|nr:uncharacterized protein ASPSYDRAFT_26707 [Aspergillus sydowii CBS 593.65]OJJ64727.1 hypothetical protein ASPSYDRAFT_26707 [Aspergillus sydowii CBS 593.65]